MAKKGDVYACKVPVGGHRKGCGGGAKVVELEQLKKRVTKLEKRLVPKPAKAASPKANRRTEHPAVTFLAGANDRTWTLAEIAERTGRGQREVSDALQAAERAGQVDYYSPRRNEPGSYAMGADQRRRRAAGDDR